MGNTDLLYDTGECNAVGAMTYYVNFRPNAALDPTVYHGIGIAAVAYVTGSIIKFTFQDTRGWLRLLDFSFGVQTAAAGAGIGMTLELDTTNTSIDNGVIAVAMTNAAGTRADVASDANTMVYFRFVVTREYGDT